MTLDNYRSAIDEIDLKILRLLNERARWALEIGKLKTRAGFPIHQPFREEQILNKIQYKNEGPLKNQSVKRIFETILEESRKLQNNTDTNKLEG